MAFSDVAPILAKAKITKKQIETFFVNQPKPPEPKPEPEITKAKIVKVVEGFYEEGIEQAGGETKLAQSAKLKVAQLKAIMKEVRTLEAMWNAINNPPEESVEEPEE